MSRERAVLLGILCFGLAVVAAFHSSGALDERDALLAAALPGGYATSPPLPLTTRALEWGVRVARLVHVDVGLFRAMHLVAGILVAIGVAASGVVAVRSSGSRYGAGAVTALLVASVAWLGADPGRAALEAGPFPAIVLLLALAALAWTRRAPAMFGGGLALGLALAEHPIVLFVLPGYAAMALGATLRAPADESGRLVGRAVLGFLAGWMAMLLPIGGVPAAVLGVPEITTLPQAIHLWFGETAPFWRVASLTWWPANTAAHFVSLAKNAGPIVLLLALFGVASFFRGRTPRLRPFLIVYLGLAAALVFGHVDDVRLANALAAWSLSFWCAGALLDLHERRPRLVRVSWLAGVASALVLLWMNGPDVDRSKEKGIAWARDSFDHLPEPSMLVTANPVHVALAAWEPREGIEIRYRGKPQTSAVAPENRSLVRFMSAEELRALAELPPSDRPLLIDPNLFFDVGTRVSMLGGIRKVVPYGLCFEIVPMTQNVEDIANTRGGLWQNFDVDAPGLPLALRGGLTPSQFYARSMTQSASVYLDLNLRKDAEREYLAVLSHPDANRTLVAYGLAQLLFKNRNFEESARTLEEFVRETDAGATQALTLLAGVYQQLNDDDRALGALRRVLRLLPRDDPDRANIEERIEKIAARRRS